MKLTGRRESTNVEDRRGMSSTAKGSMGIGSIILIGLITYFMGGDMTQVIHQVQEQGGLSMGSGTQTEVTLTEREKELTTFVKQILAGTEDAWTEIFKENGKTYRAPKLVIFRDAVTSGCGSASASSGPFYCSADECVYIDLSFYDQMETQLEAGGDFAYAYVIAHEVGHHVQKLLGILDQERALEQKYPKRANEFSVRLELQADFFAGVWANRDNKNYKSLEDGDIDEGLNAAAAIGDDRLQMRSRGYTVPETFNHGTSKQRSSWLKKGYKTGKISEGDTFSPNYSDL